VARNPLRRWKASTGVEKITQIERDHGIRINNVQTKK
jgi:hypothetical protein